MNVPVMKRVKGDGININLNVWEGGGKPLLCLHGITANSRCWDVLASILAPEYRVLAMDLRGRGQSDKPASGYSMEQHLRDINGLLDSLGLDRVVLMGHSLGAFISLVFGAKYPNRVEKIILVDGGGDLSEEQMNKVFEAIGPALARLGKIYPSAEDYLEIMKKAPYMQPWTPEIETYCRYEIEQTEGGVRTNIDPVHIQEESMNVRQLKVTEFYPQITCKVLILRATDGLVREDDILLPEDVLEKMMREIPDAEVVTVKGSNHYSIIFQPFAERDRAILEFLKR
jgi:pimeloyl-ACP methyl ester carboxylesterase